MPHYVATKENRILRFSTNVRKSPFAAAGGAANLMADQGCDLTNFNQAGGDDKTANG
jgi:hypothetical protein